MYCNVDEIKKHLNIDPEFFGDDEYLANLEDVAEIVVARHIGRKLEDLEDEDGQIPAPLKHALLIFIANLYANRESVAFASATEVPLSYRYLLELFEDYTVWG